MVAHPLPIEASGPPRPSPGVRVVSTVSRPLSERHNRAPRRPRTHAGRSRPPPRGPDPSRGYELEKFSITKGRRKPVPAASGRAGSTNGSPRPAGHTTARRRGPPDTQTHTGAARRTHRPNRAQTEARAHRGRGRRTGGRKRHTRRSMRRTHRDTRRSTRRTHRDTRRSTRAEVRKRGRGRRRGGGHRLPFRNLAARRVRASGGRRFDRSEYRSVLVQG